MKRIAWTVAAAIGFLGLWNLALWVPATRVFAGPQPRVFLMSYGQELVWQRLGREVPGAVLDADFDDRKVGIYATFAEADLSAVPNAAEICGKSCRDNRRVPLVRKVRVVNGLFGQKDVFVDLSAFAAFDREHNELTFTTSAADCLGQVLAMEVRSLGGSGDALLECHAALLEGKNAAVVSDTSYAFGI